MNAEIKSWTEETDDDFMRVIKDRYMESAVTISRMMMANPMRKHCKDAGDIAYENGLPVCVQGAILRRIYYKQNPLFAVVGGMLAAVKGSSPVSIVNVMKRTLQSRGGSVLFYADTACIESFKMNRLLGVKDEVPENYKVVHIGVVNYLSAVCYFLRRRILHFIIRDNVSALPSLDQWIDNISPSVAVRRLISFDEALYNDFQTNYLKRNNGLVSSRSAEELEWLFGQKLRIGSVVALGLFESDHLTGHIILSTKEKYGRRWKITDWIAVDNDSGRLDTLLVTAKRFLRVKTRAMTLYANSFRNSVQGLLSKRLPFKVSGVEGYVLLKITDETLRNVCGDLAKTSDGWYFGPYDGDMALDDGCIEQSGRRCR